jgi:PAS domain S-box-containing protein
MGESVGRTDARTAGPGDTATGAVVFGRVVEEMADAFVVLDRDWRYTYLNQPASAFHAGLGLGREQLLGRTVWECLPGLAGTAFEETGRRAVAEQRPAEVELFYPPTGRWYEVRFFPSPDGLASSLRDVTDRRAGDRRRSDVERAEAAARAERTVRWLADAGSALSESLDYETTLATLGRLLVPTMADWAIVGVAEGDRARRVALVGADAETEAALRELERRYPITADDAAHPVATTPRTRCCGPSAPGSRSSSPRSPTSCSRRSPPAPSTWRWRSGSARGR